VGEKATPQIATVASTPVTVGENVKDTATLSGLVEPTGTGTVTFRLYSDSECKTEVFSSTSGAIHANGAVSSGEYTTKAAGTYYWTASYPGDANNKPVSSGCAAEAVAVGPASPAIATVAQPRSGVVGATFKDKATLSGLSGTPPGGQITWTLYKKDNCSGKVAGEGPISATGNGEYSTPSGVKPTQPGRYYWVASYSGDANNKAVSGGCAAEPIDILAKVVAAKVIPGRATGQSPRGCRVKMASVSVRGREIRSVTFYLDGHKLRTVTRADPGRYLMRIDVRKLSHGVHIVRMVVAFKPKSKTKPKTLRAVVARCPAPRPVFTG
jgi:hypothetical protein